MSRRFPFDPFPVGWYAIASTAELKPGALIPARLAGHELVVYRTASGVVVATDAHCPHLGAHFAHGGHVEGESLVCPFHAFKFDPSGACVGTPYPKNSAKVRTNPWHVAENAGVVLAWWHPTGAAPTWEVPDPVQAGWSKVLTHRFALRGHPQETNENVVDIGHFSVIHGYREVREIERFAVDGPRFSARYAMRRPTLMGSMNLGDVDTEFHAVGHGLGVSIVTTRVEALGVSLINFVWATPADDDALELRIGATVRIDAAEELARWLPRWATRAPLALLSRVIFQQYVRDVSQDLRIWENKQYVHPPRLAAGDGPIGPFRAWCQQFYSAATAQPVPALRAVPPARALRAAQS